MKTTMTRTLAALAALGGVLAAAVIAGRASAAPAGTYPLAGSTGTGGIHFSNPHPEAGGTVVVQGNGCSAGATVAVIFDSQQVSTGQP